MISSCVFVADSTCFLGDCEGSLVWIQFKVYVGVALGVGWLVLAALSCQC